MSNHEPAVIVKDLYKSFRLPHEQHSGLKQFILNFFRRPSKRVHGYETQHVLEDISFEIQKGEFFGIVGRNGSGKSTLLKLLAGIYTPDKGAVQINGSLTPFIELGVGFNPELTGRENVYLNGALLGFSRDEMDAMYDDIVTFAELEKFMDQKLKNYSSGMQVRLAFSIAIRAKSDILLVDEVLAVGDEAFQRKCQSYFETLKRNKKTVILVTHDMSAVERFCSNAMFLQEGEIMQIGNPHTIAAAYSRSNDDAYSASKEDEGRKKEERMKEREIKIRLLDSQGNETSHFVSGNDLIVELRWSKPNVKNVGVSIARENGEYIFGQNTILDGADAINNNKAIFRVNLNISEGNYFVIAGLFGNSEIERMAYEENGPTFIVSRDKRDVRWGGMTRLNYEWEETDV